MNSPHFCYFFQNSTLFAKKGFWISLFHFLLLLSPGNAAASSTYNFDFILVMRVRQNLGFPTPICGFPHPKYLIWWIHIGSGPFKVGPLFWMDFMMAFPNKSYFTEIEVTVFRPFDIRHFLDPNFFCYKLTLNHWMFTGYQNNFPFVKCPGPKYWHQMYIFGQAKKWVNDDGIESFLYLLLHLCKNAIRFPFFSQEDLPFAKTFKYFRIATSIQF